MLLQRNTQAEQQFTRARFGGVAVHFRELTFQFADFHPVFFAHFRQRVDAVALGLDLPQLLVTHDHGIDHAELFVSKLVLAQLTQAHVLLQHDLAAGRLQLAAEDLHEGRLAAAVGADQAVAVAVAKFDGDVFEQRLGAKLHGDVGGGDHGKILAEQMSGRKGQPRGAAQSRAL